MHLNVLELGVNRWYSQGSRLGFRSMIIQVFARLYAIEDTWEVLY